MKIKVIEEYEIDVCELCGDKAKRDESFDVCDCCGRTYCNSCVGVLFVKFDNVPNSHDHRICMVCYKNGAVVYAGKDLTKCKLHDT